MVDIFEITENGFDKIIVKNASSRIKIIPNCGGILNAWFVYINDQWINVIEGYESQKDFIDNCESKGFKGCKLSPYVCRIKNGSYSHDGVNYTIGKFGFDQNKIHGLVYDLSYMTKIKEEKIDEACVELNLIYDREDQGFPFKYSIKVRYSLQTQNNLTIRTTVTNLSTQTIPMSDGWHPYFTLGGMIDDYSLEIKSCKMLEFDQQLIPTGKEILYDKFQNPEVIGNTKLDNCFVLDQTSSGPACKLINKAEKIKLEIFPDGSYPFLQIYTPDHRSSIAIENLSAAPDAFNNKLGLIYLKAGEEKVFSTKYKVSKFV